MSVQYLLPGILLAGLGIVRLLVEGQWRVAGKAALLGYLAVLMGGVLVLAGLVV